MRSLGETIYQLNTSQIEREKSKDELLRFLDDFTQFAAHNSKSIATRLELDRFQESALAQLANYSDGLFELAELVIKSRFRHRDNLLCTSHEYKRNFLLADESVDYHNLPVDLPVGGTEIVVPVVMWSTKHHRPFWVTVKSIQYFDHALYEMHQSGYVFLNGRHTKKEELIQPGTALDDVGLSSSTQVVFDNEGGFTLYGPYIHRQFVYLGELPDQLQVYGVNTKPPYM